MHDRLTNRTLFQASDQRISVCVAQSTICVACWARRLRIQQQAATHDGVYQSGPNLAAPLAPVPPTQFLSMEETPEEAPTPTLSIEGNPTNAAEDAVSTSSLANDTEFASAESDNCESNAEKKVFSPRGDAENDNKEEDIILGWEGRRVRCPYVQRTDIGSFGLYVGSWGGPSRSNLIEQHLYHDLILRNPAQVLVAQEVD